MLLSYTQERDPQPVSLFKTVFYMYECFACQYDWTTCMPGAWGQKRESDPWQLPWQMTLSHLMGAGKQNPSLLEEQKVPSSNGAISPGPPESLLLGRETPIKIPTYVTCLTKLHPLTKWNIFAITKYDSLPRARHNLLHRAYCLALGWPVSNSCSNP